MGIEVTFNRITRILDSGFDNFTKRFEETADHFMESVSPENEEERAARENQEDRVGRIKLSVHKYVDTGLRLKLYGMQIKIRDATDNPILTGMESLKNPGAALYAPMEFLIYENELKQSIIEYNQPSVYFDTFVDPSGTTGKLFDMKFQSLVDFSDLLLN
ncbi:hypothetical protein [Mucilaginibacter celer]|uniref:Uncharacterized protein n=1 Tax=Mucilaginibacter celer TaxID=2305508 RepID=A0A494VLD4_9SPHI|nr:hypothetical protein [Mucilaginibacter celer]AYL94351.1 hypothetical protein HYN43_003140 [Mucilaginibacter celer]